MERHLLYFILSYVLQMAGWSSGVNASIVATDPCDQFTATNCRMSDDAEEIDLWTDTVNKCQYDCLLYGKYCTFFTYYTNLPRHQSNCWIIEQDFVEYLESCQIIGGPSEPSIETCKHSDGECRKFINGACRYDGDVFDFLPNIMSAEHCQMACNQSPRCKFFLYNGTSLNCNFLDSAQTSSCDVLTGPPDPNVETCNPHTSTSMSASSTSTQTRRTATSSSPSLDCPDSTNSTGGHWVMLLNNRCYLYEGDGDWTREEARKYCSDKGGYLVRMETQEESQAIFQNKDLIGITSYHGAYIGVIKENTQWIYDNGQQATFFNWASGQPNGDGDCVYVYTYSANEQGLEWGDLPCIDIHYLLCEA